MWKTNNFVKFWKSGRSLGRVAKPGYGRAVSGIKGEERGVRLNVLISIPIKSRRWLFSVSTARDRLSRFFVGGAPPLGLALVPQLLAFGQSELHLHSAVLEVHPRGDQGQSLLLRLADQLADLFAVHQQLASPQRGVVEDVAMLIRADVGVQQPEGIVLDQALRVLEVGEAAPDGLHFGPRQNHSGFKFFQQEVVM